MSSEGALVSQGKKILRNFWILSIIGIGLLISFFIYGFYFDLWGKRFDEMSKLIYYGEFVWLALFLLFVCNYIRFIGKHDEILARIERRIKRKKRKKRK